MAFTSNYCPVDAPWIGTQGEVSICIYNNTYNDYNITISGTLLNGNPYSFSSNYFITLNAIGWVAPFPILAGTYTVVITEISTGDIQSYSFIISEYPEVMSIDYTLAQPSCSGDGSISFSYNTGALASMKYCVRPLSVAGSCFSYPTPGTCIVNGNFTTINKGQVVTLSSLTPGTYCIFLDGTIYGSCQGCGGGGPRQYITSFVINPPSQIPLDITASSVDTICDTSVGAITIDSVSGVGPYEYSWTGPNGFVSTDQDISGLEAGTYTLTVTDANGCVGTITVTIVSLPDQNGCVPCITCYKAVNCDSDCFGTATYYLTGADVSALDGFIINGLQLDGIYIDPTSCWQIQQTDCSESTPFSLPCGQDIDLGVYTDVSLFQMYVTSSKGDEIIYIGPAGANNTEEMVTYILTSGNLQLDFTATAGSSPTSFNLCAPDISYNGLTVTITYTAKPNIPVTITFTLAGSPATGCYVAETFLGYNDAYSTCESCQAVVCPTPPPTPFERSIQDPVNIYYEIKEPKCDITVTKQFATAYSNMLKKIKYGIADCCNGLNIAETWVNKQLSNLQATVIPGYNCRSIPMQGCSWLPLQGCELLTTPTDGTSILVIAGEDLVYAKLVMLLTDGKVYLNQPLVTSTYQRAIGFSTMDVQMNHSTRVLVNGMITNPAWSLVTGSIYFAAPDGNITTAIPTVGISQAIGIAVNANTLFVDIKQPNIL